MDKSISAYRELFPVTKKWAYFNHAASSPYSSLTAKAMDGYIRDFEFNGGLGYAHWEKVRNETKELGAWMLGCDSSEVAITSNTSEGANIVAQGLNFKQGDNVVVPDKEFPANLYPWLNLEQKGVETRVVPLTDGRVTVEDILAATDKHTRLVAISSVFYHNGFRVDIETLGKRLKEKGILYYVDAIQSLGVFPLDVRECCISFLAADGHKWLLAPEGAALFFCAKENLKDISPSCVSWMSVKDMGNFDSSTMNLADDARKFETGTPPYAGIAGLHQALKTFKEIGLEKIEAQVLHLTSHLADGLRKKGYKLLSPLEIPEERSGIVVFGHPDYDPEALKDMLKDAGVIVTLRGGGVRVSPHFYNNVEEVERLLNALP